jgi:hypothetical protein
LLPRFRHETLGGSVICCRPTQWNNIGEQNETIHAHLLYRRAPIGELRTVFLYEFPTVFLQ